MISSVRSELARRLEGSGVTANSLHPGAVASEALTAGVQVSAPHPKNTVESGDGVWDGEAIARLAALS